jgi:hypothetical protein
MNLPMYFLVGALAQANFRSPPTTRNYLLILQVFDTQSCKLDFIVISLFLILVITTLNICDVIYTVYKDTNVA